MQETTHAKKQILARTDGGTKRVLAIVLALALTLGMVPVVAFALPPNAPTNLTIRDGGSTADQLAPIVNSVGGKSGGSSATTQSYRIHYDHAVSPAVGNAVYTKARVIRPGDITATEISIFVNNGTNGYPINDSRIASGYSFGDAKDGVYTYELATAEGLASLGANPTEAQLYPAEWSNWSAPIALTYDSTDPVVSDVTVVRDPLTTNKFNIYGTVTDLNLASYAITVYNAATGAAGNLINAGHNISLVGGGNSEVRNGLLGTLEVTGLPANDYYVRVVATDKAGNTRDAAPLVRFNVGGSTLSSSSGALNVNSGVSLTPTLTVYDNDVFSHIQLVGFTAPGGTRQVQNQLVARQTFGSDGFYSYDERTGQITFSASNFKAQLDAGTIVPGVYNLEVHTAFGKLPYDLTVFYDVPGLTVSSGTLDFTGGSVADLRVGLNNYSYDPFVGIDRVGFTAPNSAPDYQVISLTPSSLYRYSSSSGVITFNASAIKNALDAGTLLPGVYNLEIISKFGKAPYTLTIDYRYTVTFNGNGGISSEPVRYNVEYGSRLLSVPSAERADHSFTGWYVDPNNAATKIVAGREVITSNVTYYAGWAQNTSVLDVIKANAIADLNAYKNAKDYYSGEQLALALAIANGQIAISSATNSAQVAYALANAKAELDTIKTIAQYKAEAAAATHKKLGAAKADARIKLAGYKNVNDYRPAEQAALLAAVRAGTAAINRAKTHAGVADALGDAIAAINRLNLKTAAQYTAEEAWITGLAAAKIKAKNELNTYKNLADYRVAEQNLILQQVNIGSNRIDGARTARAVAAALRNAKAAIDELKLKTDAQYTLEEDADALAKLRAAQAEARAELAGYKVASDYRAVERAALAAAVSTGTLAINDAVTLEEVAEALKDAKAAIDALKLKTDAEYTAEEDEAKKTADAAALAVAKSNAKNELSVYGNLANYRSAEQFALLNVKDVAREIINDATSVAGVVEALANAKAAIDALKTDAQYKADDAASSLASAGATVLSSSKSIEAAVKTINVQKGKSVNIPFVVYVDGKVKWSASKTKIVSVNGASASKKSGTAPSSATAGAKSTIKVKGKKVGTTTLTLKVASKTLKIKVKVLKNKKAVTGFTVKSPKSLKPGQTYVIKVSGVTRDGTGNVPTFSIDSAYRTYLKVDAAGKLTARKAYSATIPVKIKVGAESQTVKVGVKN